MRHCKSDKAKLHKLILKLFIACPKCWAPDIMANNWLWHELHAPGLQPRLFLFQTCVSDETRILFCHQRISLHTKLKLFTVHSF